MFSADEYRALVGRAGLLERTDRGRLRLTGQDRRTYLQGILTNDIVALEPGTGCYSAMLTPNGRMITDMRVLELGDAILLDLELSRTAALRDRLEQLIFAEDVAVADVSSELSQIGVYGPGAAEAVASALRAVVAGSTGLPDAAVLEKLRLFENLRSGAGESGIVSASDDFGVGGFEVFLPPARKEALAAALLGAGALEVHPDTADVTRVEAGHPVFGIDMDEETIPLEAGIEDRAISHTKGCYVGQEIIIRVLHRGQGRVARRLVGLVLDGRPPARGDRIRSADRETGTVTSAVHSPALNRAVALGYVRRDDSEPGTALTITGAQGEVPAKVVALPFVERSAGRYRNNPSEVS